MIWGVDDATVLGLAGIIAGLLTAALSFWWNYKTRSQPYQQFLYQKQIETYLDLSNAIINLLIPCTDYLDGKHQALTSDDVSEYRKIAGPAFKGLVEQRQRGIMILPSEVIEAVTHLLSELSDSIAWVGATERWKNPMEVEKPLMNAEFKIFDLVRKNAGIDPLTEEMKQVFGHAKSKASPLKPDLH